MEIVIGEKPKGGRGVPFRYPAILATTDSNFKRRYTRVVKLYEHPESGNSHKVRLLLSFLEIPYESIEVDLFADEQHGEAFLAINPRGEVPVLEDEGVVLRDSMAILVHLARYHDSARSWLPEDAQGQGAVMEWLAFAASWIQYGVFTARAAVSFQMMGNGLPQDFPTDPSEGQVRGRVSLGILERQLAAQDWLAGRAPTIADLACFPYVALAPMGDVSLEPYPSVRAWIQRVKGQPGYVSMPGLEAPEYRKA